MDESPIVEGFRAELARIADTDRRLIDELVRHSRDEDGDLGESIGRRAARAVVAPVQWSDAIGPTMDTASVVDLLGITRQALHQRVQTNAVLAIPGRRSSTYPGWQFDFEAGDIRPAASRLWRAWRAVDPDSSPLTLAAWAGSPNEDLDGGRPGYLLAHGERVDEVIAAAEATAGTRAR